MTKEERQEVLAWKEARGKELTSGERPRWFSISDRLMRLLVELACEERGEVMPWGEDKEIARGMKFREVPLLVVFE